MRFFNKTINNDSYFQAVKFNEEALRADQYLAQVKQLDPKVQKDQIIENLLQAIHFKSEEAAIHLAELIYSSPEIKLGSILSFLNPLASENLAAAFSLSMIYTGHRTKDENENTLYPSMENKNLNERVTTAIAFAKRAIILGSDQARLFLCNALFQGRGCIAENEYEWFKLNQELVEQGHQAAAFALGCYLLRISTSGEVLKENNAQNYKIPANQLQGFKYLLQVTRGSSIDLVKSSIGLAYRALDCLCAYKFNSSISILSEIQVEIQKGNEFLLLCTAYAVCPKEFLSAAKFKPPAEFLSIMTLNNKSCSAVFEFLTRVLKSKDTRVREIATDFYRRLTEITISSNDDSAAKRQRFN